MTIDVIIPLYKPGPELFTLIELLEKQSVPVQHIILMNTEEKYFEQLTYGRKAQLNHEKVKVYHLSKREFDHGGTRRRGVLKSDADIFVMMTQDAVPVDTKLMEKLTSHLKGDVAAAYARQLPNAVCSEAERFSREFNYPAASRIKTQEDIPELGIKTFFCSNVCAAYRRDIYEKLGGFVRHTIFNEDMIYASTAVRAGYGIAYEADAMVIHSHNYSNLEQLHRNFDLGVSQAQYVSAFANVPSESEGKKLVKATTIYFKEHQLAKKLPGFYVQCGCKYLGFLLGKNYRRLPKKWVYALSSNQEYWDSAERK